MSLATWSNSFPTDGPSSTELLKETSKKKERKKEIRKKVQQNFVLRGHIKDYHSVDIMTTIALKCSQMSHVTVIIYFICSSLLTFELLFEPPILILHKCLKFMNAVFSMILP